MKIYSIYKVTNLVNNKSYIGFDSNWPNRKKAHISCSFNKKSKEYNYSLHQAIRKYGSNNFDWSVIYQSSEGNHCLTHMEPYFIHDCNSFLGNGQGYNTTLGGDGCLGYKHSDEIKLKISKKLKNKPKSQNHKNNLSNSKKGITPKGFANMTLWLNENRNTKSYSKKLSDTISKTWHLVHSDGRDLTIKNLVQFCHQNDLRYDKMQLLKNKVKPQYKGWLLCEII